MSSRLFDTDLAFWLICVGTFFVIQLAALHYCRRIVSGRGSELRKEIALTLGVVTSSRATCEDSKTMLTALSSELITRGNASLSLVASFTEYHYIAIISALASGTLGGIAAFSISSLGWGGSNQALRGFFLGCAGSLSFWLTAIQVFKFQETITKHETIYATCANLLSELRFAVLCPPEKDDRGDDFNLCAFIERLAKKIDSLRSIGVSFDGSKIGMAKMESPR